MLAKVRAFAHLACLALATFLISACGGGSSSATGTLQLSVADAPVDGAHRRLLLLLGLQQ